MLKATIEDGQVAMEGENVGAMEFFALGCHLLERGYQETKKSRGEFEALLGIDGAMKALLNEIGVTGGLNE